MGLALLIVILKTHGAATGDDEIYNRAARFWAKIFGIRFALGVVTGIPMEFQFGTNWARIFARRRRSDRPDAGHGRRVFLLSGVDVSWGCFCLAKSAWARGPLVRGLPGFLGSWLSGYFIVATDAWMQHPVGYRIAARRRVRSSPASGACC